MKLIRFLNDNIIWGIPMLCFMLGTGIFLTFVTKGVIFRKFGTVMKYTLCSLFKKRDLKSDKNAISPFQAVSTALAATVGTGNIVGVAVAIASGGPGAIFWMWISSLFGMVTKYCEVTLAVFFRKKNKKGELCGGPMYYITDGLHNKTLACVFCVFTVISSFGVGNMIQSNSLANGLKSSFNVNNYISGAVTAVLAGLILIGGIKRISSVAEILVPFMALFYIFGAAAVLFINAKFIPAAFISIFKDAFTGTAAAGGFLGSTTLYAMRIGVARGVFTNEAGIGSAPIAHACAQTDHPSRQGLWGSFEVFFDTIVMCTVTALVIITTGIWKSPVNTTDDMSQAAFNLAFPGGEYIITIGLVLFAFATIIAWYYYGEKALEFLTGGKGIKFYRLIFTVFVFVGAVAKNEFLWEFSDLLNGLMAIPNLFALIMLSPIISSLTKDFFSNPEKQGVDPKTNLKSPLIKGKLKPRIVTYRKD